MSIEAALAVLLVLALVYAWSMQRRAAQLAARAKKNEEQLHTTARLLVQKNVELVDENVRQQKQLEAKADFIGIVSHQLRTPLTELKWGIEDFSNEMRNSIGSEQAEHLQRLAATAHRMMRIIDNLVQLVRTEQAYGSISAMECAPDSVVRVAADRIAGEFPNKRLTVRLGLDAPEKTALIDADSLDMIVGNLIENAYHYTPDGGVIEILTERAPEGGFRITIKDNGIGIPAAKVKSVFMKFQRSDSAMKMNVGGMGIGLYIVKNAVEKHGGSVSFTSEEGEGSTFVVSFTGARS